MAGPFAETDKISKTDPTVSDLKRQVEELSLKLNFLREATKALASTLDLGDLLGRILEVAKSQADAERGTLFLVDEKAEEIWSLIAHGTGEAGDPACPSAAALPATSPRAVKSSTSLMPMPTRDSIRDVDARTGYRTRNLLCLPIRNKTGKDCRGPPTSEQKGSGASPLTTQTFC